MSDYLQDEQYNGKIFTEEDIKYKEFENCTFTNCDFRACTFQGVYFFDCVFIECNFNDTKVNYVSLRGVQFKKCDFTNVNFAMTDQVIYDFSFTNCTLDYAKFYKLKLKKMLFTGCSLVAADFMESDLTEAIFDNCDLRRTVFIKTIANKTDFSTSYNYTIDPEQNKLKKAQFSADGLKGLLEKYDLVIH
ncbi:pentapeptide repeat-containing protein [Flavobacterium sp.]|jgi:uncharacterized protein YjbI with pentapeptide repeats|uniref:pentapeptide repeat-containing protein n=1 Tax=Flavobacterium sp. TaxID=239 RepID=UPI002A81238F|nr:pentapeptide repeat-containing protein [Flavobacterium sp.]